MAAIIHNDSRLVDRRLSQYFNSRRDQWIDIAKEAVRARARCTDDHARSAPGYHAWDAATARTRQIFRREGWEKGDLNGIETIINRDFKRMIAILNTDSGTCDPNRSPRNRTKKGPAAGQLIDLNNQADLFKGYEMGPEIEHPYSLWYYCIHDDGKSVRSELSRPIEFADDHIVGFSERIFILQNGDWEKVLLTPPAEDRGPEFEINVRRK